MNISVPFSPFDFILLLFIVWMENDLFLFTDIVENEIFNQKYSRKKK